MGVYIKGMEMPETCEDCNFHRYHSHYEYVCVATPLFYPMNLANSKNIRKDWCPLVEVPTPHGDLIDRDEVRDSVFHHLSIKGEENLLPAEKSVFGNIIKAKAVIKAEGE